jgi:hypothetical protein
LKRIRGFPPDFWVSSGGFDDLEAAIGGDRTVKKELSMDYPTFDQGSMKEEFQFPDLLSADGGNLTAENLDLWSPGKDVMTMVLGDDSTLPFTGLMLNDDVYLVANKELAVNVFPAAPSENELTWCIEGQSCLCDDGPT